MTEFDQILEAKLGKRNGKRMQSLAAVVEHLREQPDAVVVVAVQGPSSARAWLDELYSRLRAEYPKDVRVSINRATRQIKVNGALVRVVDVYRRDAHLKVESLMPTAAWYR